MAKRTSLLKSQNPTDWCKKNIRHKWEQTPGTQTLQNLYICWWETQCVVQRGVSNTFSAESSSASSSDWPDLWFRFSAVDEVLRQLGSHSLLSLPLALSWTNSWISSGSRRNLSWYSWSSSFWSCGNNQNKCWVFRVLWIFCGWLHWLGVT